MFPTQVSENATIIQGVSNMFIEVIKELEEFSFARSVQKKLKKLEKQGYKIVEIKYSCGAYGTLYYSAMIIYEE